MTNPAPTDLANDPHPGTTVLKSSRDLLRKDRSLSLLPFIGGICSVLAAIPLVVAQVVFDGESTLQYLMYALTVFIGTLITTFFGVALSAGAAVRMEGGDPTIGSCIGIASRNIWSIVRWALFATLVGLILRAIEARLKGFAGVILRVIGDATFAVASYFVIPMLAHEQIGPLAALRKSADTVRAQWRTTVRFTLRMGWWAFLVFLGSFALFGASIAGAVALVSANMTDDKVAVPALVGAGALVYVGLVVFVYAMLYVGAVSAYGRTALYRYASGRPVPGFSTAALQGAAKLPKSAVTN